MCFIIKCFFQTICSLHRDKISWRTETHRISEAAVGQLVGFFVTLGSEGFSDIEILAIFVNVSLIMAHFYGFSLTIAITSFFFFPLAAIWCFKQ